MDLYHITSQEVLERLSRHCPEAISTYLQCVNRADKNGEVFFSRYMIEVDISDEFRTFRTNIKKLARENLLSWMPLDNGISISLVDLHENE